MNLLNKLLIKLGIGIGRGAEVGAPLHIFVLDDDARRHAWFHSQFPRDLVHVAATADDAIEILNQDYYDAIFLDHDLLPEHYNATEHDDERTGYAVARWLADNPQHQASATITVHTRNADAAMRMVELLRRAGREVDYVPFPMLSQRLRTFR